jgi:hypothetical protein
MARMYGKMRVCQGCKYGCCVYPKDKDQTKREEETLWVREFEEEILGDDYYHWQLRRRS